jgi:hypothetical protein
VIMRKIIPGCSPGAIVFPDGSPLTFAKIGAPMAPLGSTIIHLYDALFFRHRALLS